MRKGYWKLNICFVLFVLFAGSSISAQSTAITYQGKLSDGFVPATGTYEMQFQLHRTDPANNQVGPTLTVSNISVVNGIFSVSLDFGTGDTFTGEDRFLQIAVRKLTDPPGFTLLTPRQPITNTPHAIHSKTSDSSTVAESSVDFTGELSGNVTGTQGSTVVNSVGGQSAANVANAATAIGSATQNNVPGTLVMRDGSGGFSGQTINAVTQYNIGGNRLISVLGTNNLFVGLNSGTAITTGTDNTFFGSDAGRSDTSSRSNSFFGSGAGISIMPGGNFNSFFGQSAGSANTTGHDNAFFGQAAGIGNKSGSANVAFGLGAGLRNTTGNGNTFVGFLAGDRNTTGGDNTVIGKSANVGSPDLSFATALGSGAIVNASNTVVLGRAADKVLAPGLLQVNTLGAAGSTSLCRNSVNQISTCTAGNLTEVTAEQTVAINELRERNTLLSEKVERQERKISALTKLVCATNPEEGFCKGDLK